MKRLLVGLLLVAFLIAPLFVFSQGHIYSSAAVKTLEQMLGPSGKIIQFVLAGENGQDFMVTRLTELTTISSTTQQTTIQIPADAIVYAVPVRVVVKPAGTNSTMTVTATTSSTAFQKGANISSAATTTDIGTKNTPVNYNGTAAQTITLTFDGTVTGTAGRVRVDIIYAVSTAPTS